MPRTSTFRYAWQPYVVAIALIAAATALRLWPLQALGARLAWLTFYPAVAAAALYGGFSAGLLGTILSCLALLYLWPVLGDQPFIRDSADWLGMAVFAITSTMISFIAEAMHRARARAVQAKEQIETANIKLREEMDERKQAEEALRKSEEKYRTMFDSIDVGVCTIEVLFDGNDKPVDYRFLEVNPSFEKQTGIQNARGRRMREIAPLHEEHWFEIYGKIALTGQAARFENQAAQLHRWYDVYAFRVGEPQERHVAIHFKDITERKQAEEAIKQLNARLELSNKELEAFSYSVSHDLRAPLRALDGFSQALLEDYAGKLDEQGRDHLNRIRAASQRMAQLIDDMLSLARVARTEMRWERVDLSKLAKTLTAELKNAHSERAVEFRITDGATVTGDARLLRLVLENLLNNAWKFTSKQSKATIEFGVTSKNGESVYFVHDDGAGFDMVYAGKLFGVFQRLHAVTDFPGTGVGLATVQRIIHRHGGRVWAEGAVGRGATFYFTLVSKEGNSHG